MRTVPNIMQRQEATRFPCTRSTAIGGCLSPLTLIVSPHHTYEHTTTHTAATTTTSTNNATADEHIRAQSRQGKLDLLRHYMAPCHDW